MAPSCGSRELRAGGQGEAPAGGRPWLRRMAQFPPASDPVSFLSAAPACCCFPSPPALKAGALRRRQGLSWSGKCSQLLMGLSPAGPPLWGPVRQRKLWGDGLPGGFVLGALSAKQQSGALTAERPPVGEGAQRLPAEMLGPISALLAAVSISRACLNFLNCGSSRADKC